MSMDPPTVPAHDLQSNAQSDTNNYTTSEATRKADSGVYLGDEHKSVLKDSADLPLNQSILYPFSTISSGEATIMDSPLKYDEEDEENKLANLYEGITEELSDNEPELEANNSVPLAQSQSQSQPTEIHRTPSVHINTENLSPSIRRQPSVLVTPPQSPINHDFNGSSEVHSLSALLDQGTGSNEEPGELQVEVSNPSHLFWVPAAQHPEIAPNGYANWLVRHSHGLNVSNGKSGVRRRKSVLSVSYGPEDIDKEEDEDSDDNKPKRKPSVSSEPTKNMLQTLEEQEQEAEAEGNFRSNLPTPQMSALRRSVSLNANYKTAASDEPEPPLLPDIDSPIVAGRTGLKRAARTNKRQKSVMSIASRNDLPPNADGTSRRWGHREPQSSQYENPIPENERIGITPKGGVTLKDEPIIPAAQASSKLPPKPPPRQLDRVPESSEPKLFVSRLKEPEARVISLTPKEPTELEQMSSLMESNVDFDKGKPTSTEKFTSNTMTPSIINSTPIINSSITVAPVAQTTPVTPTPSKKTSGLFSRLLFFDEKQEEKEPKPRRSRTEPAVPVAPVPKVEVVENDISPAAPLSNTKVEIESSISALSSDESQGNRKSSFKDWLMSKSRGKEKVSPLPLISDNSELLTKYKLLSRFPIHVERAIYRLSHFKLADPRRPLQHQVLISNLMFWYLSIIKQQTQNPLPASKPSPPQQQKQTETARSPKKAGKDGAGSKKGRRKQDSIQKRNANGSHPNQRRASETAYRAPQYEIQAQQYRTPPPQPPPHQQIYSPNPSRGQMHMGNQQQRHSAATTARSQDGFRDDNESGDDSANDSETDHERGPLASFQPDSSKLFNEDENIDNAAFSSRLGSYDMNDGPEFRTSYAAGSAASSEGGRDSFSASGQPPWAVSSEFLQGPKGNFQDEYFNSGYGSTESGFLGKGPAVTALSPISLPTFSSSPSESMDRRRSQSPGRQPEGAKSFDSNAMSKGLVGGSRGIGLKGMRADDDEDNVPLGMYRR